MSWFRRGPRPPLELPELSAPWAAWAGRLRDALVVVETHGSDAWLVFSADPHVGVARLGDGFAVSSGKVPVPPEHLRFFPPSAGAWQSPHDLTTAEAAHACAALLSYVLPDPSGVTVAFETTDAPLDPATADAVRRSLTAR